MELVHTRYSIVDTDTHPALSRFRTINDVIRLYLNSPYYCNVHEALRNYFDVRIRSPPRCLPSPLPARKVSSRERTKRRP